MPSTTLQFTYDDGLYFAYGVSNRLHICHFGGRISNLTPVVCRTFRSSRRIGIETVRRLLPASSTMIHSPAGCNLDTTQSRCGAKYSDRTLTIHRTYHQQSSAAVETRPQVWLITGYICICCFTIRRS
jgi:hypothetical protein